MAPFWCGGRACNRPVKAASACSSPRLGMTNICPHCDRRYYKLRPPWSIFKGEPALCEIHSPVHIVSAGASPVQGQNGMSRSVSSLIRGVLIATTIHPLPYILSLKTRVDSPNLTQPGCAIFVSKAGLLTMSARSQDSQEKTHPDSAVGLRLNRQLVQDSTGKGSTLWRAASRGDFRRPLLVGEGGGKSRFLFIITSSEERGCPTWVAFTFCKYLH
jgi:hypothetical protein